MTSLFSARVGPPSAQQTTRLARLSGELDMYGCDALVRAVSGTVEDDLVLDLGELSFIDAAGLGTLVRLRAERCGRGTVVVRNVPPRLMRVFTLAGLGGLVEADARR